MKPAARSHCPPDVRDAWSVVRYARLADRPCTRFYLEASFDSFRELHGDRRYRDDPAICGGIASLEGRAVIAVGHERGGAVTEECMRANFGMPFPEGFHKARRLMDMAERFRLPLVSMIDTPGAYPGLGAEERGQPAAIAELLACMASLTVPTVAVVVGQGGSGGAFALALADRVLALEFAVYSVISPEGCASILWHSENQADRAAAALRLTVPDLVVLGVVDEMIPEPAAGITVRPAEAAVAVRHAIARHLAVLERQGPAERVEKRAARYATLGRFAESHEVTDAGRSSA